MTIKKFLHSCIVIEDAGKRLLIDPGSFSFIEEQLKPEDLPPADILLLTHEHVDHFFPEAIQKISQAKKPEIITHERIAGLLKEKGIESKIIKAGETVRVGSFVIEAVPAPHGALIVPTPENLGFLINGAVFHPGDSLEFKLAKPLEILFLPITAPWVTIKEAYETALRVRPKIIIPIHDAMIKDFMLLRLYDMLDKKLGENGIAWKPLKLGEAFKI